MKKPNSQRGRWKRTAKNNKENAERKTKFWQDPATRHIMVKATMWGRRNFPAWSKPPKNV